LIPKLTNFVSLWQEKLLAGAVMLQQEIKEWNEQTSDRWKRMAEEG
jgi:hypothetical protein